LPSAGSPSSLELAGTLDGGHAAAMTSPGRPGRFRNVKIAAVAFTLAAVATAAVLILQDRDEPAAPAAPASAVPPAPQGRPDEPAAPRADQTVARPPASAGTIDVRSTPEGAAVSVDGTARGTTPIAVSVEPGRHKVRIELEGYD